MSPPARPHDGSQAASLDLARRDWLLGVPASTAALLMLLDRQRPDRLGHFLAGFGATLVLTWVVALVSRGRAGVVVAATLACIGAGHVAEAVRFPLGGYDVLDVAAQSVGALLAGAALIAGRAGDADEDWFDASRLAPSPYGRCVLAVAGASLVAGTWSALA